MRKLVVLILIIWLCPVLSFSQDIYVMGNMRKEDRDKMNALITIIEGKYKPKIIELYHNSVHVFTYERKANNNDIGLDAALNRSKHLNSKITNNEVATAIDDILMHSKRKKQLIIFNKHDDGYSSTKFQDFDKLINYVTAANKRTKPVFLLVFNKDAPTIEINSPKTGSSITSKKVTGNSTGSEPISIVYVRLNGGDWQKANGTTSWTIDLPMQKKDNLIEAKAIDNMNDTSLTCFVKDISMKPPRQPRINYIYPDSRNNVPPNCINGNIYCYSFKISLDVSLDINDLVVKIDDANHKNISEISLADLSEGVSLIAGKINDNSADYCFHLSQDDATHCKSLCCPSEKTDYYYYLEVRNENNTGFKTVPLLVHFYPFGPPYINCECE